MVASEEELIRWVETGRVEYSAVRDLLSLAARSRFEGVVAGSNPQQVAKPKAQPTKQPQPKPTNLNGCRIGFTLSFDVAVKLASEANIRDGVKPKIRRKKEVKLAVRSALELVPKVITLPCVVTMIRLGPRKLDSDNLATACKPVRDVLAEWIGIDDADERIQWKTKQKQSKDYLVRVRLWCRGKL